ncbi:uncharacterized protein PG986_012948 [Apiospora aurea]|uniref:Uncharacterized protein n=1 Tax=Apiospora aurea TaxID=335848 RepID=A0ABR1Q1M3_9PEZI
MVLHSNLRSTRSILVPTPQPTKEQQHQKPQRIPPQLTSYPKKKTSRTEETPAQTPPPSPSTRSAGAGAPRTAPSQSTSPTPVDGDGADVPAVDDAALGHVEGLGRVVVALAARVELEPAEVARRRVGREEVAVEPDGVAARAEARLEARRGAAFEQRHLLPRAVAGLGEVALAVDEGAVGGADGGGRRGVGAPVQQVRLEPARRRPAAEHVVAVGEVEGGFGQARRVVGQRAVQRRREGELRLDGRR